MKILHIKLDFANDVILLVEKLDFNSFKYEAYEHKYINQTMTYGIYAMAIDSWDFVRNGML